MFTKDFLGKLRLWKFCGRKSALEVDSWLVSGGLETPYKLVNMFRQIVSYNPKLPTPLPARKCLFYSASVKVYFRTFLPFTIFPVRIDFLRNLPDSAWYLFGYFVFIKKNAYWTKVSKQSFSDWIFCGAWYKCEKEKRKNNRGSYQRNFSQLFCEWNITFFYQFQFEKKKKKS